MSRSFFHTALIETASQSDVLAALQFSVDKVVTELGRCHSSLRIQQVQWNGFTDYARSRAFLRYLEAVTIMDKDLEADALQSF